MNLYLVLLVGNKLNKSILKIISLFVKTFFI